MTLIPKVRILCGKTYHWSAFRDIENSIPTRGAPQATCKNQAPLTAIEFI